MVASYQNNRRNFIKKSIGFAALSSLPWSALALEARSKFKLGLQLYTIRDAMKEDPIKSLEQVHLIGYQDLETYGYDPLSSSFYNYKAATFKSILEDHQLTTSTGHYDFSQYLGQADSLLQKYTEQCIVGATSLGQAYITWPWVSPKFRSIDAYKAIAVTLNKIGEMVKEAGLGFAYHNHGYEFEEQDGTTAFDIVLSETDSDLVKIQLDFYWVMHSAKETPAEIIAKDPLRYVMWHIKDMDKISRDYTELGNGSINYEAILKETSQEGLEYFFLEQGGNYAHSSMQSIAESSNYFKEHLQKYL